MHGASTPGTLDYAYLDNHVGMCTASSAARADAAQVPRLRQLEVKQHGDCRASKLGLTLSSVVASRPRSTDRNVRRNPVHVSGARVPSTAVAASCREQLLRAPRARGRLWTHMIAAKAVAEYHRITLPESNTLASRSLTTSTDADVTLSAYRGTLSVSVLRGPLPRATVRCEW